MPKSSKKTPGRKDRQLEQHTPQNDFTLAEFADAAPTGALTGRMKKATTRKWDKNVTELCVKSEKKVVKDGLEWYEKDLSDFEIEDNEDIDTEDEEAESECAKKNVKKKAKISERYSGGVDYPYDVWCLIGDFIEPECIAKFAAICKTSHTVVHTAGFWSKMYKRYYVPDCGLPEELLPRFMEKSHGMRARVVRSLYFMYTPLVARVNSLSPFGDEPDTLLGSRCAMMWYKKFKSYWRFYFKLQRSSAMATCPLASQHSSNTHNSLRRFEPQVDHNPEQNLTVLQITTVHYIPIPVIMGYQLVKTSLCVGHAMRYHKIKLIFSPVCYLSRCGSGSSLSSSSVTVVIDHVVSLRVLNWWDPKYPYKSSAPVT